MQVSEEGLLGPANGKNAHRDRNPHIDAAHSAVRPPGEFAAVIPLCVKITEPLANGCRSSGPCFLEILDPLHAQNRPEDLLVSDRTCPA